MKISNEFANTINMLKKSDTQQRRTDEAKAKAYDSVMVENKQASSVSVATIDEVRELVQNVTSNLSSNPAQLHNLSSERLAELIS
ncbi:MAG: hypothetical protein BWY87_00617 [Deltaproteobacteria bacterium ADurb.Bin510]|nr:MAG: hypothetical protein BWY87_00617 [Deltaproteobacteria bacterium ADurb.Bin510]